MGQSSISMNGARANQVLEDGLVHRGQCSAARSLLLRLPLSQGRLAHDPALPNDHYVLATELFLELRADKEEVK